MASFVIPGLTRNPVFLGSSGFFGYPSPLIIINKHDILFAFLHLLSFNRKSNKDRSAKDAP
jgi:hypothetical protein